MDERKAHIVDKGEGRRTFGAKAILILLLFLGTVLCLGLGQHIRTYTGRSIYLYLNWDMFLAWVPMGLALSLEAAFVMLARVRLLRAAVMLGLGGLWLFFYPNSGYLITDLLHPFVHYRPEPGQRFVWDIEFWHHLMLFFSAACIGIVLSFISLFSVQRLVRLSFGSLASWLFAVMVLGASSIGIYIGRFVRWNSWDVWVRPRYLLQETVRMFTEREQLEHIVSFSVLIFAFTLIGYLVFYVAAGLRGRTE
ncbi:DUF1361 domain-containing protein [Paenibacillus gansuensis]|uniref:DUF1361 domain-containing protein n=1 Tax=Paenibacillus gansuensis TaxID=306542 RepID=A0ABW5PG69_9BACL